MKFKTRLRVTFATIILLPMVLTAMAFIAIGIYLMNTQPGFGVQDLDYSMMSESMQTIIETTDETFGILSEQAREDPARLEDIDYLETVRREVTHKSTYILVRKGNEIYYTGNAPRIWGRGSL